MAGTIENVRLSAVNGNGEFLPRFKQALQLKIERTGAGTQLCFLDGSGQVVVKVPVRNSMDVARLGRQSIIITEENDAESSSILFSSEIDCRKALSLIKELMTGKSKSIFTKRTDNDSATQYFQFYSYLSQQQNMMQDYIRTGTYQRAMLANLADFSNKVVLDVGAGSGILSFFAVQAGARKVYAVEASNMAQFCERLVRANGLEDKITVIAGKIEETELPELVDTIISEPIGYMLFNERMIETYLHAKKFLKPGGAMYPTQGHLFIAPFTDDALYQEQSMKCNFWCQQNFHGVDLTALRLDSFDETFKQPVVDTFSVQSCMAPPCKYTTDFLTTDEAELYVIDVPLVFTVTMTGNIHGLAFWFDLAFVGSNETIWLSTSPTEPLTHWYQVRCLLKSPVFVRQGQMVSARLTMRANSRQSYDVEISVNIPGTNQNQVNVLDLKNPYFRYGGQMPVAPAQNSTTSPTEQYYANSGYQMSGLAINGIHDTPTNLTAPINPGSIPSVGFGMQQPVAANRTSIGGGLAPHSFAQASTISSPFSLSNAYMIGDYAAAQSSLHNRSNQ